LTPGVNNIKAFLSLSLTVGQNKFVLGKGGKLRHHSVSGLLALSANVRKV